jgi:hypothetical protein
MRRSSYKGRTSCSRNSERRLLLGLRRHRKSGRRASLSGCIFSVPADLIIHYYSSEKRQEKAKVEEEAAEPDPASAPPPPPDSASNAAVTRHPTEDPDAGETEVAPKDGVTKEAGKEPHPPAKKYRMTESMKTIVWTLVALSNEHCRLENEKQ